MMKPLIRLVGTVALILITTLTTYAQSSSIYTVKSGDTFFSIARTLNLTVSELKEWNNLSGDVLEVGQELIYYPKGDADTLKQEEAIDTTSLVDIKSNTTTTFYIAKSGDSLYKIALDNGMSVAELKAINNLTSDTIRIGQRLAVKSVSVAPVVSEFSEETSSQGRFALYNLERRDNLNSVLKKFKMRKSELQALNPEIDVNDLSLSKSITVLMPPSRNFPNPFTEQASLQELGSIKISEYQETQGIRTTTNGELYNADELTAAHSNISLGTILFVENVETGQGIYVRVNDRMTEDGLKLSSKAFRILGFKNSEQPRAYIFTDS